MTDAHPLLASGYTIRPPTRDDLGAIVALLYTFDQALAGEADPYSPDDILADWSRLDPATDAWVIVAPGGALAGYATLTPQPDSDRCEADGYVHPDHLGRGLGTTIIALTEARAAAIAAAWPGDAPHTIANNILADNTPSRALLEAHDYHLTRVYFRMHITLDAPPSAPVWPAGIAVRACDGGAEDIRRAYETVEEAFQDHFDHTPRTFEDWHRFNVGEDFDPSLWFLAMDGGEVAGVVLGEEREPGRGWVGQLAVRRPWRGRGLGMALLRQAFGAFHGRGLSRVGLGVDGESLTGANRLYERAGMTVTTRIGHYEKSLR